MVSLRAKRTVFTGLSVVLLVGAAIFSGLFALSTAQTAHGRFGEARDAQKRLAQLKRQGKLPTNGRVKALLERKGEKETEARRCSNYFLQGDAPLELMVFRSFEVDRFQFAEKYRSWKDDMVGLAGQPGFLPGYKWETASGKPNKSEFREIERKACIVDALVRRLAGRAGGAGTQGITNMAVGSPTRLQAPPHPGGGRPVARCRTYPVTVRFRAAFSDLPRILDALVSRARRGPSDPPALFVLVDELTLGKAKEGSVLIGLELRVIDVFEQTK